MKRWVSGRSSRWTGLLISLLLIAGVPAVLAGTFIVGPVVQVSDPDPPDVFASCTADDAPGQIAAGSKLFPSSEVEPWMDVNPANPKNIVGTWQQDRWNDGGSRGLRIVFTKDGGTSWHRTNVRTSLCAGGTAANGGDFPRASDPWLSFGPTGALYHVSLSFVLLPPASRPGGFGPSALLVSKSTDGGATWGDPITIIRDTDPRILNDKEAITADPNDAHVAYLVWDRLQLPVGSVINPENLGALKGVGFKGPAMISRTTNGGASWEEPRVLYDPGANNQTIDNQIVILPKSKGGTVIDVTDEILSFKNPMGEGKFVFNIALFRSSDMGVTWPAMPTVRITQIGFVPVNDPNTGQPVRTGDIIPEVAVDHNNGNLYLVWQDGRFSGFARADVAFAMSTDGGLTWTTPVAINKTQSISTGFPAPDPRHAFTPSVAVSSDGSVAVTYYDFRHLEPTDTATLPTDYWVVTCNPSHSDCTTPANWSEEHIAGPFDMKQAPIARGFFVGDYEGLAGGLVGNVPVPGFQSLFVQAVHKTTDPATSNPSDVFSTLVGPGP